MAGESERLTRRCSCSKVTFPEKFQYRNGELLNGDVQGVKYDDDEVVVVVF